MRVTVSDLLGKEVAVQSADPPDGDSMHVAAEYVHNDRSRPMIGLELAAAASIAAAVGLIPRRG